ncbi:putative RING-H2 finger protein ATL19 [Prunus yedoensis var. nudiflora]|uniref:Putative RING-H2 finger protein ATL19 n=1 Tax=Prunus yedoensis var. nudiflora TaxID=2094558 RepID=A0A314XZH1_PRUYE|nr:putative RING-H2 finger protein ATL19 [Prunus yedoensis var. nudiflora]
MSQALKIVIPPPHSQSCFPCSSCPLLRRLRVFLDAVIREKKSGSRGRAQKLSFQPNGEEWHDQATFYQAAVLHNLRILEILTQLLRRWRKEETKGISGIGNNCWRTNCHLRSLWKP